MPWPAKPCAVMSFTKRHARTDAACEAHNIAIQRDQTSAVFARLREAQIGVVAALGPAPQRRTLRSGVSAEP